MAKNTGRRTRAEAMAVRRARQLEEITMYTEGEMSLAQISAVKGVSPWIVRKDLLDAGVAMRPAGRHKSPRVQVEAQA